MSNLQQFTDFLKHVPLGKYRAEYRPIKIVEMDLPKDIQAISILYKVIGKKKSLSLLMTFIKDI